MIGNGMIGYRAVNGMHWFQVPLSDVKEARRNAFYLANVGGFHITRKNGETYNFAAINNYGQYQSPDALLAAIHQAMGQR